MNRIFTLVLVSLIFVSWNLKAQTQASAINFQSSGDGVNTSLKINWTSGTSTAGRVVLVRNASGSFTPINGANISTLSANSNFSSAADLDVSAGGVAKAVYAATGAGSSVLVSNLSPNTTYVVQVYEFTGSASNPTYLLTTDATNPRSFSFYTTTGTFTVPNGVTSVLAQAWGAGAGGGQGPSGNSGSGGGGGGYASGTVPVAFGVDPAVSVGSGGGAGNDASPGADGGNSSFGAAVIAVGGKVDNAGGTAAGGTGSTGTTTVDGGTGGQGNAAVGQGGGGGGSSGSPAGAAANGGNHAGTSGGVGGDGPDGDGGDGGDNGVSNAVPGTFPGGGGGGRGDAGGTGGAGAGGLVIVSYVPIPTGPTVQASNVDFTGASDNSLSINWTNGNGQRRLVIAQLGSAVTTDPSNNTPYTASSDWNNGAPSGTAIGSGFVVYDGTGNSFTMTNMVAGTYHFAVYEYNGASTATGLFDPVQATGSRSLVTQASGINITNPATTSLTVNWTNGSGNAGTGTSTGTGRIVIVKTNGAAFTPSNGTNYTANTNFSSGSDLNGGSPGTVKCVFTNTNATQTVNVTNLAANTAYTFEVYEFTGTGATRTYTLSTAADNPFDRSTVHGTQPNSAASAFTFGSITNNSITATVSTPGNGASRMVVVSTTDITWNPADGTSYTANTDFTSGPDVDPGGDVVKVIGFGSGPFVVSGLSGDVTYRFAAFEFNGAQGTGAENYFNTEFERTRNTEPTLQASWNATTGVSVSGMTLNWTQGNGDRRVILMREGAAVNADPSDLTLYAENANWGTKGIANQEVGTGNYVVYEGSSSTSIGITNLQANTTYHFAIYEYNSNDGGVVGNTSAAAFLTPAATSSQTTSADVSAPAAFAVGTVTAKGGREIGTYWNSTNTTIDVVVPLASDPTLDLGTVQLQLRNTSPTAFVNISNSGLSTITHSERNAGTKTISVSRADLVATAGFAEAATLKFNAIITDFSGNSTLGMESAANTSVDEILPTLSGAIFLSLNGGSAETLSMSFSEQMGLANNADPIIGTPGFTTSTGSIVTSGATMYSSGPNTLVLQSGSNNDWSPTTTLTYTPEGTGAAGNYMTDVAGNEMATFTQPVSDTDPPVFATGFVFNPNGSSPETITFSVSEELNLAESAAVIGFASSAGTIASAIYTGKNTTNTITLTSGANGQWTDAVTISYTLSGTSNVKDPSGNELAAVAAEPILLRSINIASNNAVNPTTFAKLNDVISVTFTSSRALSSDPVVTIGTPGQVAVKDGAVVAPNYKYDYNTAPDVINEGNVVFTISANETGPPVVQTATGITTNSSAITYDKTAPSAPAIPDFLDAQDDGPSSTDNYTSINTALNFSGLAGSVENNSTVNLYRAGSTLIGTTTANGSGVWSIVVPSLPEGVHIITAESVDAAGNTSPASTAINPFTIDNTPPVVANITLPDANPNNTSSVDFTVIFNNDVYNVDIADFAPYGTASGGTSVTNVMMNSPSNYTVTVSGISTLGSLGLNFVDLAASGTVLDFADNEIGGPGDGNGDFASPTQYSIVLPEPQNHVTAFNIITTTFTSMTLTWVDAIGSPSPSGYLITVERSGATALVPTDFTTPIPQQTNLIANTTGYMYVNPGVQSASFTQLLSGETYVFRIYPFTNSGTDSDYKTDGVVPTTAPTATPVDNGVWVNNSSPLEPANFPSTTTSSGVAVVNFRFQVHDSGWGSPDNASTKITEIRIQRDVVNDQIGNWFNALQGVELTDGSTTKTGTVDAGGNFMTFSGLYDGSTEFFGEVADNATKFYMLKVILRTSMGGNLPQTIDNRSFRFVIQNVDITVAANSSTLNPGNDGHPSAPSSIIGNNRVDVVATQLDFSTQPNSNQLVLSQISSAPVAPDFSTVPVIRARDVNGNTDLDFGGVGSNINLSSAVAPLSPTVVNISGGVAILSAPQYQDSGDGTLSASTAVLASNGFAPAGSGSSAVSVSYSNATTIASVGGSPNTNVPSTGTSFAAIQPYRFSITDDGGPGIGDGSPTRISEIKITKRVSTNPIPDWRDILNIGVNGSSNNAGAIIWDGTSNYLNASVTINQNDITISNMSSSMTSADLGYIGDGATKTYQLYIWVRPAMTGGLPSTVDFMNFDFEVDPSDIVFLTQSSTIAPAQLPINSGLLDVDVAASRLAFITEPPADVLVNTDLTIIPVVEAQDAFGNRDLDYSPVTGISVSNLGGLPMTNVPSGFSNGILTFPANFQYTQVGNGTLTLSSSTVAIGLGSPPTSANSTTVTVRVGTASTITAGALSEPAFISSIADDNNVVNPLSGGTDVFDFTINDDPVATPANQNDGNPTRIQSITITQGVGNAPELANWTESIGSAQLSDGSSSIFGVVNPTSIVFAGIPNVLNTQLGHIVDDASKTYTLKIWLKESIGGTLPASIDGKRFQFEVTGAVSSIVTNPNGTSIISTETENSGVSNEVEVTATQIDFTTQPSAASVNVDLSPQIEVSARDANGNLDTEFTGSISATGATPIDPGPFGTTNNPSGAFAMGQKLYPSNFQFTAGNGNVELTITAGGISGTSSPISIITSFDSWLYFDPAFAYTPRIDFVNGQEATTTSTSQALGRLILSDGGSATSSFNIFTNPNPGVPNQANHQDIDGSFTSINDFTISLSNFGDIRSIGLYQSDGTTQIGSDVSPAANVTFTGLSSFVAPDNGTYEFYIRASFNQVVTDLTQIAMQVTAVTHNAGSKFAEQQPIAPPPTVAGVDGAGAFGDSSPLNILGVPVNVLDVIATSLDFTTQASPFAGINEPVGPSYAAAGLPTTSAATVEARDKFTNLDLEFNPIASSIQITSSAGDNISSPAAFTSGVLDLDGMQYSLVGNGTLRVQANGLDSSNPPGANTMAEPGDLVNVINVTATIATNGVLTSPNIKGGSINQVLFGVTFTPDNNSQTNAEPSLSKFIFTFDKPYETPGVQILKNFDVKESDAGSFAGSTTVTLSSATITKGTSPTATPGSFDQVIVDWGANPPRDLFNPLNGNPVSLSYFLVADIDATANISTPTLTPQLLDAGFGSPTDDNIVTSVGTAFASGGAVVGNTYQFASTRPPELLGAQSNPFNGQLNVDPAITFIDLAFDVEVVSLDGVAELFDRSTNTKVADLVARAPGNFTLPPNLVTSTVNPIRFDINFLPSMSFQPDGVYYVVMKKGTFDNLTQIGEGISDSGLNFYGGITSNGTYYFKISSQNPPTLVTAVSSFSNTTLGSFRTTFDQAGTAYYLVLNSGSPAPTTSQILDPTTYPFPGSIINNYGVGPNFTNSYSINQVNTPQTVTFSGSMSVSTSYDVYIFARNDAQPNPIPATGPPYGPAPAHAIGDIGPTFVLTVPSVVSPNNQPTYLLCPESFVNLSAPIVIGENNASSFFSPSVQDFFILLPSGYQFDGINKPNVQLNGSDFSGPAVVDFVNTTLVHVTYINNNTASLDNIVISDLRLIGAEGSAPGSIRRFAGTNVLGSNTTLASIAITPATEQKFTNSYAAGNTFIALTSSAGVTAIPDNYVDQDPQIPGAVRLIPNITPANDYGASFFNGPGVTDDKLTLSAVSLNSAFDITMLHTDPNGCLSEDAVQYLVYDHRSPISAKLGASDVPPSPLAGTRQALSNPNFPALAPTPPPVVVGPGPSSPTRINSDDLAGYRLIQLDADLPANSGSQIMNSTDGWGPVVQSIPVVANVIGTPNIPNSAVDPSAYRDYQWDYSKILNATEDGVAVNPYNNFIRGTTVGNTYWQGGSLGKVEFTGLFQSTADFTVLVPFRQEVEIFLPAIPLLEISSSNGSSFDTTDGTINIGNGLTPDQNINSNLYTNPFGYQGTPIFCEAGGVISVNGFPAATAGTSSGIFAIYDYANYDFSTNSGIELLPPTPSSPFVDNGNGTATLDPTSSVIQNSFNDLLITYRFQEDDSPAVGYGYLVIRIAPNPVATFAQGSPFTPETPIPGAYCEDRPIEFNGTTSGFAGGTGNTTVANFSWDFGDPNLSTGANPNTISGPIGTADLVSHKFIQSARYTIGLTVTSDVGCSSPVAQNIIDVGAIPDVAFRFEGVSTAVAMSFDDESTESSAAIVSDDIGQVVWDFGDGSPTIPGSNVTHLYSDAGIYSVEAVVSTLLGCTNRGSEQVVMVNKIKPTDEIAYQEDFESGDGNWQVFKDPSFAGTVTWGWGTPTTSVINTDSSLVGTNVWTTNLTGEYSPLERSYLYTTCFDMTELLRPMVSFNSLVQIEDADGVVFEYSTDNKNIADPTKVWTRLGDFEDSKSTGVDWYNALGLASKPGDQTVGDYGWSGRANKNWRESKHILDTIANELAARVPSEVPSNVVFRFGIASVNSSPSLDGFAMDNIRVGNRTRTIVVENFTNKGTSGATEKNESDFLKQFNPGGQGTKLVKLNYHVGFPQEDPFNLDNPADPSARALFYNITETPRARLDGFKNPEQSEAPFTTWGSEQYGIRTLQLAQAELSFTVENASDGSLEINVEVNPKIDLGANTVLHVAILEKNVPIASLSSDQANLIATGESDFEFVLKRMLPTALGTRFNAVAPAGQVLNFGPFNWYPEKLKLYSPSDDLAVIAFLQNEDTKEILQSEIIEDINDPPLVTGLDFESIADRIAVFPNPADGEVTVQLPTPAVNRIELQMVDQMGRVVNRSAIEVGEQRKEIYTRDMAAGIYLLQFGSGNSNTFKKVMVVHK